MTSKVTVRPSKRMSVTRSLDRLIKKLGAKKGIDVSSTRSELRAKILELNDNRALGYLAYHGILDLRLPDGTTIGLIPDWHIPAHNKQVSWMVKDWLKANKFDIIIIIGDAVDMFGLSRWPKAPGVISNTQHEFDEVRRMMDQVIELSGAMHIFYILGNHEDRNRRSQVDPNANVAGLLDPVTKEPFLNFHNLMGYTKDDPITFIYGSLGEGGMAGGLVLNGDVDAIHGQKVRSKPGQSPAAESDVTGRSVIHGHTHRLGKRSRRTTRGGVIRSIEMGHLTEERHSFMGYAVKPNWTLGVSKGRVHGGKVHIHPLPILPVTDSDGQKRHVLVDGNNVFKTAVY